MKTTKKILESKFRVLCKQLNKTIGHKKGDWNLDNNPTYGGYVIVEYMEDGGEFYPILSKRLPASQMESVIEGCIALKRVD